MGRLDPGIRVRVTDFAQLPLRAVGPESFDAILTSTSDDPHDPQRARLITATHEAGHGVIGTLVGLDDITVQLDEEGATGANSLPADPEPSGKLAAMLVAGFAAVGVLVGDSARKANQGGDQHHLPDSDLNRGIRCAKAELGDDSDPDAQVKYLERCEAGVLEWLDDESVRNAVKHAAAELYHHGRLLPGLLNHICDLQGL